MKIKSEKNVVDHKFQKSISPIFCLNSLTLGNKTPHFTRFFPILLTEWGCSMGFFSFSIFQNGDIGFSWQFGDILRRLGYSPHSASIFTVAKWGVSQPT